VNNPKVSVLMLVYNTEKYLREAIDSILNQTFSDFEFLIFNDGSTDSSLETIRSYTDKRIKLFDSDKNIGLISCLNRGIDIARGEYIARMDSDDISAPNRLEKQVSFMDKNPDIGVCGSWYDLVGEPKTMIKYPVEDRAIRVEMLRLCPICHPSVILRSDVLKKNRLRYDEAFIYAEDYRLWVIMSRYCKFANIQEVLLHYRIHKDQVLNRRKDEQLHKRRLIMNHQIESLLNRPLNDKEKELHALLFKNCRLDRNCVPSLEAWVEKLLAGNRSQRLYPEPDLLFFLKRNIYYQVFMLAEHYNLKLLKDFWFSHDKPFSFFSNKDKLTFTIKCLLSW
jgi:glycosyltransferase involved in cell wall biosynthesis